MQQREEQSSEEVFGEKSQYIQFLPTGLIVRRQESIPARKTHFFWVDNISKGTLQQGVYYNLVKDSELNRGKFHKCFRMSAQKLEYIINVIGILVNVLARFVPRVAHPLHISVCG